MEVRLEVPDWRSDAPFCLGSDRRLLLAADCDGLYVSLAADVRGLRARLGRAFTRRRERRRRH
jgi:hypothetical protein